MKKRITNLFVAMVCFSATTAFAQTDSLIYTGAPQKIIIPACVDSIQVVLTGAEGGASYWTPVTGPAGALGGRVQATLPVLTGDSLVIYVGGHGDSGTAATGGSGGYNGGGNGHKNTANEAGGGGGGASDIRLNGRTLADRIVIAGGGGGSGYCSSANKMGGGGGGLTGASAIGTCQIAPAKGGSQTAGGAGEFSLSLNGSGLPGSLGQGGNAPGFSTADGGGGGGGYYGGGSGGSAGGGGGSGYAESTSTQVTQTTGVWAGNGYVVIRMIQGLTVTVDHTNTTCSGHPGTANAIVSCGLAPYTYLWSPGGQTTDSVTGLSAGTYTVTVHSFDGLVGAASVTIGAAPAQMVSMSQANITCHGMNNGTATANVSGGTLPYSYNWSPVSSTNNSISGLSAGTYSCTVTDSCGSMVTDSVTIIDPPVMFDSIAAKRYPKCYGDNTGKLRVGVRGGTPYNSVPTGYTYIWTGSGTPYHSLDTNLIAGSYTVLATDSNGCSATASFVITQPTQLRDSASSYNNGCFGMNNGKIVLGVKGGTIPYTYIWSPNVSTVDSAMGLSAGTYSVTTTDNSGCSGSQVITTLSAPTAIHIIIDSSVSPPCSSYLWAITTGGNSPYEYKWSPGTSTADTAHNLCAGNYTVVVTDKNGCKDSAKLRLVVLTGIDELSNNSGIKVYPVPTTGVLNVDILNNNMGVSSLSVYDITGREMMRKETSINATHVMLDVSTLNPGIYFLRMTGTNGPPAEIRFEIQH